MCYIEQNPLKAGMVKYLEEYPYSSYHYFLKYKALPVCLKDAWVAQNYKEDKDAIEAFLTAPVDSSQLQELKKAASLVEAPNMKANLKLLEEKLQNLFDNVEDKKERNKLIVNAVKKGYSQHLIAKVLGISQPAVYGVVKRSRKNLAQ
jgi:DNA-directed RNA polymerase specialized sigma subunit